MKNAKFKFVHTYCTLSDPEEPHTKNVVYSNAVTLSEVLSAFEDFLRGSGFVFDGAVNITKEDE